MALSSSVPVSRSDARVKRVLAATFPDYRGRKIRVAAWSSPVYVDWNWSGGTRDFVAVIAPGRGVGFASVPAPWRHDHGPVDPAAFPAGSLLVVHSIFCGSDAGITIYASPSDALIGGGAS